MNAEFNLRNPQAFTLLLEYSSINLTQHYTLNTETGNFQCRINKSFVNSVLFYFTSSKIKNELDWNQLLQN